MPRMACSLSICSFLRPFAWKTRLSTKLFGCFLVEKGLYERTSSDKHSDGLLRAKAESRVCTLASSLRLLLLLGHFTQQGFGGPAVPSRAQGLRPYWPAGRAPLWTHCHGYRPLQASRSDLWRSFPPGKQHHPCPEWPWVLDSDSQLVFGFGLRRLSCSFCL